MQKFAALFAVSVALCASAASATVYECKLPGKKNSHTVPDEIYIDFDPAAHRAMVFDAFINNYFGEPIEAEVLANNDKRLTIGWNFENITARRGGTIPHVWMKATIVKATMEVHATTSFGYGETESGFGTCKSK